MFNIKSLYTNCAQRMENNRVKPVRTFPHNPHVLADQTLAKPALHSFPQNLWVSIPASIRTFYTAFFGKLPQESGYLYPTST
jgi:hypothetical protein